MSQAKTLPTIKRIELSAKNLKPLHGSKPVGATADGTVIWEGYVSATNPHFINHDDPHDNGHERTPVMDPLRKGEQKWRRNKSNGEAITPIFKAKRKMRLVRYIMADRGNGEGGPMPVPEFDPEVMKQRELEKGLEDYSRRVMLAAMKRGVDPEALIASLVEHAAPKAETNSEEEVEPEPQPSEETVEEEWEEEEPKKRGRR